MSLPASEFRFLVDWLQSSKKFMRREVSFALFRFNAAKDGPDSTFDVFQGQVSYQQPFGSGGTVFNTSEGSLIGLGHGGGRPPFIPGGVTAQVTLVAVLNPTQVSLGLFYATRSPEIPPDRSLEPGIFLGDTWDPIVSLTKRSDLSDSETLAVEFQWPHAVGKLVPKHYSLIFQRNNFFHLHPF
jgi:hypothetical protein